MKVKEFECIETGVGTTTAGAELGAALSGAGLPSSAGIPHMHSSCHHWSFAGIG